MIQIKPFSDHRFEYNCSYCGGDTGTKDHVPSKVFLDNPFPENLPVVPACDMCNQNFSLDEEYVACLIEAARCRTTNVNKIKREKIKEIFEKRPSLQKRIEEARFEEEGIVYFKVEEERLINVITKLAKGHIKYEYSEPQFYKPNYLWCKNLRSLSKEELESFFSIENPVLSIVPEIGSRSFQRSLVVTGGIISQEKWIDVQAGNYSYMTEEFWNGKKVKIIIGEFLAIEVVWMDG